ncbi:MAG TPA: lysozyme inhibitor LprI family protein, partial [Streptosporangiaceae bacterium]|nr:lysozyme inhibitor LprI family protein [Streptosporangiaceae bacterium]
PGHPAQAKSSPADCGSQPSTLAIEQCYEASTENTDAQIDTVQQGLYNTGSSSAKSAILAQDSLWLAARGPVCQAAFNTGGTIDGISIAACLLDESTARLDAVKNIVPPEAKLKSTDSTDPNDLSWYTTPEGSRMAEIDTQGDQTGGAVISWVIVGGAQGFVINPKQFFFQDGSFTDPGIIQGTNPTYHKVPAGVMYQFGIDYSTLSSDPNAAQGSGGYVYVPGTPVAVWR